MPGIQDTYADPMLTDMSVKYQNDLAGFICEKIFPTVQVKKKSGYYFTYGDENLRIPSTRRRKFARANRVEYSVVKTAYGPLIEHTLEDGIEDDEFDQADSPLQPRQDAVETLTEMLYLEKEYSLAAQLSDAGIITQNTSLSGTGSAVTNKWDDNGGKPFQAIQTALDTVMLGAIKPANTIWMGYQVWSVLMNHADFLERIKYTNAKALTIDMLKNLFPGVENVFIGNAVYNTAKEGQTKSTSFVWGKHLWVGYISNNPKLKDPSLGYHLQLKGARQVDRWDDRAVKAEFVRITDYYEPKLVSAASAYGIFNAIA